MHSINISVVAITCDITLTSLRDIIVTLKCLGQCFIINFFAFSVPHVTMLFYQFTIHQQALSASWWCITTGDCTNLCYIPYQYTEYDNKLVVTCVHYNSGPNYLAVCWQDIHLVKEKNKQTDKATTMLLRSSSAATLFKSQLPKRKSYMCFKVKT